MYKVEFEELNYGLWRKRNIKNKEITKREEERLQFLKDWRDKSV